MGDPGERKTMAVMDYRTRDGLADYGFSIEFQSDTGWRVYIVFQSFLQHRDNSVQLPYQSIDGNGRRYVDWSGRLDNLGDAKAVAALWAELAERSQRIQEQHALYVELIERYQRTQEQRSAALAGPDRLAATVGADGAGSGHQDRGPIIPYPRAAAESLSDL